MYYLEVSRHLVRQLLGILCYLVVEVDGGGVLQQLVLLVDSCNHLGVAVTNAHGHDACKGLRVCEGCRIVGVLIGVVSRLLSAVACNSSLIDSW